MTQYSRPSGSWSMAWTETIAAPGASYVSVHFETFDLADGDVLLIRDVEGDQSVSYTGLGRGGLGRHPRGFWSGRVHGEVAILELWVRPGNSGFGAVVDRHADAIRLLGDG